VVAVWADRIAPIDAATAAEDPPARVWRSVQARIAADGASPAPAPGRFGSLALWRGLAIAASAVAAALIIYIAVGPSRVAPPVPAVVAVLADQSGDPAWIASAGPQQGEVSVRAVRPQAEDARHSFELWGISGGKPQPLGLLPQQSSDAAQRRRDDWCGAAAAAGRSAGGQPRAAWRLTDRPSDRPGVIQGQGSDPAAVTAGVPRSK
jgi:anti-sigma-K factor RskA